MSEDRAGNADEAGRSMDALVSERVFNNVVPRDKWTWKILEYDDGAIKTPPLLPHYSTDIAAAFEMEAEIERRGLLVEYAEALVEILSNDEAAIYITAIELCDNAKMSGFNLAFAIAHASPLDRCRAALAALEAK